MAFVYKNNRVKKALAVLALVAVVLGPFAYYQLTQAANCDAGWTDLGDGRCRIILTTTGAGTLDIPAGWNNSNNLIEVIGGGGGGGSGIDGRPGGGGGAYASTSNLTLSGTVNYSVATSGATTTSDGVNGGWGWFNGTSCGGASVCAGGGNGGTGDGLAGNCVGGVGGTVQVGNGQSGGAGGVCGTGGTIDTSGGGGGAGGVNGGVGRVAGNGDGTASGDDGGGGGGGAGGTSSGNGNNGFTSGGAGGNGPLGTGAGTAGSNGAGACADGDGNGGDGTTSGAGGGGGDSQETTGPGCSGGNGAAGTEWTSAGAGGGGGGSGNSNGGTAGTNSMAGVGGLYGGGGGGGLWGGAGAQGVIVVTYTRPVPVLTQDNWRWYSNANNLEPGSALAAENATTTGVATGDTIRLRMNISVASFDLGTSSQVFILQYASTTIGCPASGNDWVDVLATSTIGGVNQYWIQDNNTHADAVDGATTTSLKLSNSTKEESYEESNPSVSNLKAILVGEVGEWDWVIRNNGAPGGTTWCFRMVKSDHTTLDTYNPDGYPALTTAAAPVTESHYRVRNDDGGEGNVTEFGTMGSTTSNPAPADDNIMDIELDGTSIFSVGFASSTIGNWTHWRIEKRDTLIGAFVNDFGTGGVLTVDTSVGDDVITDAEVDGNYLYLVGNEGVDAGCRVATLTTDCRWRLEKRNKTTGNLCDSGGSCAAGAFATSSDGFITYDPSLFADPVHALHVDDGYVYVAGTTRPGAGNLDWVIMKLNKDTGALCDGVSNCADGEWGVGGFLNVAPGSGLDRPRALAGDNVYLYIAGEDANNGAGNTQWRIEKRRKSTSALVSDFGTSGVVQHNISANDDQIFGMAIDPGYIYLAGFSEDISATDATAHVQKRNIVTGALCSSAAACSEGVFGTTGDIQVNIGANVEAFTDISIDPAYLYVGGYYNSGAGDAGMLAQKRNRVSGALCSGTANCAAGQFGTSGEIQVNPSSGDDVLEAVAAGSDYAYFGGYDAVPATTDEEWRLEKRNIDSGSYITTVTGGATWDVEDTASTTSKLINKRLRLQVKNDGNAALNYKYRLQVAAKGAAASCEAVSGGSFSDVPVAGSCGSSVACMADSGNVTDGSRTTSQLTSSGNFVYGYMVDNASNQTGTSTLYKGQYTEHEYVFQFTALALPATAYCFRLTNAGTALTTYSIVAQISTPAPPTVTTDSARNFNGSLATLFANLVSSGGGEVTEHGFAYGTDSGLASGVSTTTLGSNNVAGIFKQVIGSLIADTTYYFRAYGTNSAGEGYGSILSFTMSSGDTVTPGRTIRLSSGTMKINNGGTVRVLGQ